MEPLLCWMGLQAPGLDCVPGVRLVHFCDPWVSLCGAPRREHTRGVTPGGVAAVPLRADQVFTIAAIVYRKLLRRYTSIFCCVHSGWSQWVSTNCHVTVIYGLV